MEETQLADPPVAAGDGAVGGMAEVLAEATAVLGRVPRVRDGATHAERLAWLLAAQILARQSEALFKQLVAEADSAGSSMQLHGTPTTSWLALGGQLSPREVSGIVKAGKVICDRTEIARQTLDGSITTRQASAINTVLEELPVTLSPVQRTQAVETLVRNAQTTTAEDIRKSTATILELVRPAPTEEDRADAEQIRLAEQRRRAHQRRSLFIWDDGDGSTRFKGSLPTVEAEGFRRLIAAYVESERRRGRDEADPRAEERSGEQRRADALLQLTADHQARRGAPGVAGDRPRVVVVMQEESLRRRAEQAGQLSSGEAVTAGDLRRIVCDAELAPVVLGSASEVLDVGRSSRLVTPALRRALTIRDGACQFPNCDVDDEPCEAHHVRPWWAGGDTSLANLVLLCPHHHKLLEPERFWTNPGADSWQVRIRADGAFEFLPPSRVDPARSPLPGNALKRKTSGLPVLPGSQGSGKRPLPDIDGRTLSPPGAQVPDAGSVLEAWEGDPDLISVETAATGPPWKRGA